MDGQESGVTLVDQVKSSLDSNLEATVYHEDIKPNITQPKIDLQKDLFEIENRDAKDTQSQEPLQIDFTRSFPAQLSLEIQSHLENALREIVYPSTPRDKEREGILNAEHKIRYKILEQAQTKEPSKKGTPVVKPKRVIVRRKKVIHPARRLPKYLPNVDGGMWKVWGYPEFVELSTSSSEEVVEIPEGVELDQDGYPIIDPDRFDLTSLSPKWLRFLVKIVLYLLQSMTGFFMVKYAIKLWRSYTREAERVHSNKPPNISESSDSESEKDRDPRLVHI